MQIISAFSPLILCVDVTNYNRKFDRERERDSGNQSLKNTLTHFVYMHHKLAFIF